MQLATNLLSLALVASSTWAAPVVGRQDDLQLYQLKVSSPDHGIINGQYLVVNGTTLGLMMPEDQPPVQVYTTASSREGLMELHTYPVGIVDHAVGLHGPPGLLNLVELVNPEGDQGEDDGDGLVKVWDTFHMSDEKLLNEGEGEWYSFPVRNEGWVVKWYDGTIGVTDDYIPVEIIMEKVGTGNYNDVPN